MHVGFFEISHLHTHQSIISLIVTRILWHHFTFRESSVFLLELFDLTLENLVSVSQCCNLLSHLFSLVLVHSQELDVFFFCWSCFVAEMVLEGLPISDQILFILSLTFFYLRLQLFDFFVFPQVKILLTLQLRFEISYLDFKLLSFLQSLNQLSLFFILVLLKFCLHLLH